MTEIRISAPITRRLLLASAAVAGSVPILGLNVHPAMAKVSQASVAYQDKPKGDQNCANCSLFEAPSSCKTVDGAISPDGWCRIWAKKRS
jgi:High potential iron-sulfur protein